VKNKGPHIKPFILKTSPNEKDLTQMGSTLALIPSIDGVGNNSVKVRKGWVTHGSLLRTTWAMCHATSMVIKHFGMLVTGHFTPKILFIKILMYDSPNPIMGEPKSLVKLG